MKVLRSRQRQSARSQGGFALLVVLFVIALTALMVAALLGLSFATTGLSIVQDRADRDARAADSAMEAALNQVARDVTGNLGFPKTDGYPMTNDCTVPNQVFEVGKSVDDSGAEVGTGVKVHVDCVPVSLSGGDASLIGVAQQTTDGSQEVDRVRVIGSEYRGDQSHENPSSPVDWTTDYPWSSLLGADYAAAQSAISNTTATLVHQGPGPLSISADVEVSKGAAGARTDDPTKLTGLDPAIGVTGTYTQGDKGLLDGVKATDTGSDSYDPLDPANSCGVLQISAAEWNVPGAGMRAGGGATCDDPTVRGVSWLTSNATSPAPVDWTSKMIADTRRTVGSSCPNAPFQPGAYDRTATAQLNTLLANCGSTLFQFLPGNYWFDAESGSDIHRSELRFDNPNLRVVFGTIVGGGAADAFPQACDPTKPGVSITLSPRTSIRHVRGRVAICGQNGPSSTAIWQSSGANLGWEAGAPVIDPQGSFTGGAPGSVAPNDGLTNVLQTSCVSPLIGGCGIESGTIALTGFGQTGNPGQASINSVQLMVKGDESRAGGPGSGMTAYVYVPDANAADPAGRLLCSSPLGPLPHGDAMAAYELLGPAGTCRSLLTNRAQLVGTDVNGDGTLEYPTIKVRFDLVRDCGFLNIVCVGGPMVTLDYLAVRIPWTPTISSAAPESTYNPSSAFLKYDGVYGSVHSDCSYKISSILGFFGGECAENSPRSYFLGLQNLSDLNDPESADPNAVLESAGVVVKGKSVNTNVGASTLSVQVTFGGPPQPGRPNSCTATLATAPHDDVPIYVDLLGPGSTCGNPRDPNAALHHPSQLVGAKVLVTTTLDKNGTCIPILFCSGWGADIDYIDISTTVAPPAVAPGTPPEDADANSYEGPRTPFLVTSNNKPGSSSDAVFSVYGRVELPRADLDVHWNGPYAVGIGSVPRPGSIAAAPVFNGSGAQALVVNGIGSSTNTAADGTSNGASTGKVGVLCCDPAKPSSRRVRLTAWTGTAANKVIVGTATVLISDQITASSNPGLWAPGQHIAVEDWTLCSATDRVEARSGCTVRP